MMAVVLKKMDWTKLSTTIFLTIFLFTQNAIAVLSPADENFYGVDADRLDWSQHPCRRTCNDGAEPLVCKYVFVVEKFSSMSKACYNCPFNVTDCFRPHCIPTDGVQKPVYVVNRQLPGPLIEVCQNDWVVIEVRNLMLSESFTIHWHGFKQFGTPFSDGVPFVTQCPILPGDSYQYYFNATTTGTFFWHSHTGSQRSDGLFGPMIVNDVRSQDIYVDQYDYDIHRLVINEWKHNTGDEDEIHDNYDAFNAETDTILINGLGRYTNLTANGTTVQTPTTIVEVEQGKKYRVRMINGGSENCPMEVAIDNHTLLIIALDSKYIKPVEVDIAVIWAGERVDFILNATCITPGNYYIRVRGLGRCASSEAYQIAILRYTNVAFAEPRAPVGYQYPIATNTTRVLNPYDRGTESDDRIYITIPDLTAMDEDDLYAKAEVDQQVFIALGLNPIDNFDFHRKDLYGYNNVSTSRRVSTVQLNHITMKFPPFPLLTQYESITPDMLCNASYVPLSANCSGEQCACTHVINVKLNDVIEIVMIDQGAAPIDHPMHLHGHFFHVVASVNLNQTMSIAEFQRLDRQGLIERNLNHAPIKDTMKVPSGGYTIVRFLANNPGYWFFHCHFEPHSNMGMALVWKVGEHKDFAPRPKGFPTCGHFTPESFN